VREFLASKQITAGTPSLSPDLAPSDFFLFPKVKEILKIRHFDDVDDIRNNVTTALKAIPQNQFQNCFEGWTRRWHPCIASQGQYLAMRYLALLLRPCMQPFTGVFLCSVVSVESVQSKRVICEM
jgi:hypothetical protein